MRRWGCSGNPVPALAGVVLLLGAGCAAPRAGPDPYSRIPDEARALYEEGVSFERDGYLDEAIARYRRVIEMAPGFVHVHRRYQDAMIAGGRREEVRAEYRERLRASGSALDWCLLGRLETSPVLREFRFRKSVEIDPDFGWGYFALACQFRDTGRPDLAVRRMVRAMEHLPGFLEGREVLGDLYRDLGRWDDAIAEYLRYLAARPKDERVRECLAGSYLRKGTLEEAERLYRNLIAEDDANPRAHLGLGVVAMERGDRRTARIELERARALDPANPDVYYNLGLLREEYLRDPGGALESYRRYLELGGTRRFRVGLRIRRLEEKEGRR